VAGMMLLDLIGGVALLLWGLHMVQTGILRAFGSDLRRYLGTALKNRVRAFAFGLGVTAVLQSSTATALMTSSFAAGGLLALTPALAIMLGANVGTTLIVQLLSFNVTAAAPILLAGGLIAFKRAPRTRFRDLGRVAIAPSPASGAESNTGVARGKVYLAKQKGQRIPEGWAINTSGAPTTDPAEAIEGNHPADGTAQGLRDCLDDGHAVGRVDWQWVTFAAVGVSDGADSFGCATRQRNNRRSR
jgi:hypothetical protein